MSDEVCHICGRRKDEHESETCPYVTALTDRDQFLADFDTQLDPIPEYPFPKTRMSSKEVAWIVFSRLYVLRLNSLMCIAPVGFKDELQVNFGYLCTKHSRRFVMFECDDICEKIGPEHFQLIMANRQLVYGMIIRSSTMYPGTARSLSEDEAMILATALGLDGVGKLIPLKLENGSPWSSV